MDYDDEEEDGEYEIDEYDDEFDDYDMEDLEDDEVMMELELRTGVSAELIQ